MEEAQIVAALKEWLGEEGARFFRAVYEQYGTLIACWIEGEEPEGIRNCIAHSCTLHTNKITTPSDLTLRSRIPHPVHFREGMQVRNFIRSLGVCWTAVEHDERWENLVLLAIRKNKVAGNKNGPTTAS